jgi:6-phosphogluconolactonase
MGGGTVTDNSFPLSETIAEALPANIVAHGSATNEIMARDLAAHVARHLSEACDARGQAVLAVSGGRSPIPVFEALRRLDVPWSKVIVTLVDERWVPDDHADSNAGLVRRHLLQDNAAAASFVPWYDGSADPYAGQAHCEAALQALPLPFDVVLLGMGDDGHTASLFPEAPELAAATDLTRNALCAAIMPPAAKQARLSLTRYALARRSARLVLQWSGAAKREVFQRAVAAPTLALPISLFLHQTAVPVDVWYAP